MDTDIYLTISTSCFSFISTQLFWENNSNSVWYAMKFKIHSYTSKSWMEMICQSFIQELISRIQISKPVRISLSVTVKVPGNVFLHVSNTGHSITSFPPFWMPLEIVCLWKRGLIIQRKMFNNHLAGIYPMSLQTPLSRSQCWIYLQVGFLHIYCFKTLLMLWIWMVDILSNIVDR